MDKQTASLQARIDRTAAKLAALKAQRQAREAREKTRHHQAERAMRNRALVLWGVALERATLASPDGASKIRALLEKHLTRDSEREAALNFLDALGHATPTQPELASSQNGVNQR